MPQNHKTSQSNMTSQIRVTSSSTTPALPKPKATSRSVASEDFRASDFEMIMFLAIMSIYFYHNLLEDPSTCKHVFFIFRFQSYLSNINRLLLSKFRREKKNSPVAGLNPPAKLKVSKVTGTAWKSYCWWFRNPVNSSVDMVVYPIIYKVSYITGGWEGDFWAIDSILQTWLCIRNG